MFLAPYALSNLPPQQKMIENFYSYIYLALSFVLIFTTSPNYLTSLALPPGYNTFITDKALTKFEKSKHSVLHSDPCLNPVILHLYFSITFKSFKILSRFGLKATFKLVKKN